MDQHNSYKHTLHNVDKEMVRQQQYCTKRKYMYSNFAKSDANFLTTHHTVLTLIHFP